MNPRDRVRAVKKAYEGPVTLSTPDGDVAIETLVAHEDGSRSRVEVTVSTEGDPHFVIVNPPTLVPDPNGEHIVRGERFREDPVAAVAHVIAAHGGSVKKQKDARKGRR